MNTFHSYHFGESVDDDYGVLLGDISHIDEEDIPQTENEVTQNYLVASSS